MGRKAGVTADQTRAQILSAARAVFARKGYDGATMAEISAEAAVSTGAIYAHFPSKAKLFAGVLEAHGRGNFERLLGLTGRQGVARFATIVGSRFDRRPVDDVALILEVIVASSRDPELMPLVRDWLISSEERFAGLVTQGQTEGIVDCEVPPDTVSRLALMISLGSILTAAVEMPEPDHGQWAAVVSRIVDAFRFPAVGPSL